MTDSSSKDPKKPGLPGAGDEISPLGDLLGGPVSSDESEPIILDMEEEAFALDHAAAAPTAPAPAAPEAPAPKAPAQATAAKPAVIFDDPSLGTPFPPPPRDADPPAQKKARPEYTNEMPSMMTEGIRERFAPPPAPSLERQARAIQLRRPALAIPRPVIVALVTAAVAGGAFWTYLRLRPEAPVITSVMPPKAEPGQTVTVTGTGFDPDPARVTVRFGDQPGQVTSASETQLAVTVPASLAAAEAPLRIQTRGGRSNALFLKIYRGPRVTAVEPPVALPSSEVVLRGENLAGPSLAVQVGGLPATVKESTPTALRILVPDLPLLEGRAVAVTVQVEGETGRPAEVILGRLPLVTQLAPASGPPGTRVTIKGHGFDPDVRGNQVVFGGERALLLSATPTEIAAIVPPPPTASGQHPVPVVIQARAGISSGAVSFTVMSPSESSFLPRYFPASVAERPSEDVVSVSTELGPVLLLAGKADAPSTVERGLRAAAALNAVVQSAASSPAAVEARDKPATGVALAGSPSLLVAATAEDADAYAREPAARGQRATPRALAEFWAALLQDQLTLFVQRQRPLRVVELSPRGKVLLDLFSEAERRGGVGSGVPVRLVRPLTASLGRSLRDMAMVLPAGPSTAAAAVAGRWEGTMQDGTAAPRRITLNLRLQGTRLAGSLTTRLGAVAMDVPLRDLTYDKGRLGFVLTSGAASHLFSGAVEGAAINGTIRDGTNDVGRFSLRYAE